MIGHPATSTGDELVDSSIRREPGLSASAVLMPTNNWETGLCNFADSNGVSVREGFNGGFLVDGVLVYQRNAVFNVLSERRVTIRFGSDDSDNNSARADAPSEETPWEDELCGYQWPASRLNRGNMRSLALIRNQLKRPITRLIHEAVEAFTTAMLTKQPTARQSLEVDEAREQQASPPTTVVEIVYHDGSTELHKQLVSEDRVQEYARTRISESRVARVLVYELRTQYFNTACPSSPA